jgi:hypothetical protein
MSGITYLGNGLKTGWMEGVGMPFQKDFLYIAGNSIFCSHKTN